MKTIEGTEIPCNNCGILVVENKTELILAQGLMMPNWLGGWKKGDEKYRHGFSILLRVCSNCYNSLNTTCNASVFRRAPFQETHNLQNFYAFHAEKVEGGGHCVRRKYPSDSYYHARGYFWGKPESVTIMEENKFVYD
ncbi:MAG TPA: hypothetical protein DCS23_01750 [Candidatus Yonathbacteria bacterium]|nr:hypothetical protein [Candidatus Yonathbacteria bacterium]